MQRLLSTDTPKAGQQVNNNGVVVPNPNKTNSSITATDTKNASTLAVGAVVRYNSINPNHGRYQKTLQQLNESSQLTEQDERSRLSALCRHVARDMPSFNPDWDGRRQAYVSFAPDKKSIVWDAAAPARAVAQLHESCQFLNSPQLQNDQLYAKDSLLRRAAYDKLRNATNTAAALQTKEGQDALRVMVREGLYDNLRLVLSKNLSFDRIYADAPHMQSKFGQLFLDSTMLVLTVCRLGQDCGEGSVAANDLCASFAVCGGSAEDAILRDAHQLGYDVNLISKHINEIIAKLQAGNFEDLKPKESFEQMIKRILKSFGLGG